MRAERLFRQNAFFLQRADSLSRNSHLYLLPIDHERFFLKIWLKNPFGAAQRKANVVAELLAFTGDFTSRCHITSYSFINISVLY